ncbi:C40 family peptidase [Paenibacillus sp. SYP-B4298]|uniref:C40 family peptidase n=1 Tax=Paenibacillus sp. SYP-B4298 TaxID=2996034 RepID=UPI0022DE2C47|nr:C40 family peptidase [Paenibacillus sp. SYP-B4298]
MRKRVAAVLSCLMLLIGGGSVFASPSGTALQQSIDEVLGTPYLYGGTTTGGFDCSGFILHILSQYDVELPRTSQSQAEEGTEVQTEDLRIGDLVFFNTSGKGVSHAGIYVGDGQFAHSSSSKGVIISSLTEGYYAKRYVTARRVATDEAFAAMTASE